MLLAQVAEHDDKGCGSKNGLPRLKFGKQHCSIQVAHSKVTQTWTGTKKAQATPVEAADATAQHHGHTCC
jgi:hypothetical protein